MRYYINESIKKKYFEQFSNKKILKRLNEVVEGIKKDHTEGHCEHIGECDTFITFVKFLKTKEGKTSLNALEAWVEGESDEQIYEAIVGKGFEAIKWVDNDKMDEWIKFVKSEGIEVVE